jgi:hypothetical protein
MKALLTAFAMLSFLATTTIPYVVQAQTSAPTTQTAPKAAKKKAAKKSTAKKASTKKKVAKKKKVTPST